MRNDGLCLALQGPSVSSAVEGAKVEQEYFYYRTDGIIHAHRMIKTTAGNLSESRRFDPTTGHSLIEEYLFKTPSDYVPLLAMVQD